MKHIISFFKILKDAGIAFVDDKCMKLSASLSYYTLFSIGPLLVIIISLAGIFLGQQAVQGQLFDQIHVYVGDNVATQIQEVIINTRLNPDGNVIGISIGILILVIGATTVFAEIQDSINYIWGIKAKPKRGWLKWLKNRFLSFSLIISCAFLLLVSLLVNIVLDLFGDFLAGYFHQDLFYLFYILNFLIVLTVIAMLFAIIFKVLPDGKIRWKDTRVGAIFTALLFILGKFLISLYLNKSNVGVAYGAAGSIIILLTWVYYTSLILYYGAEFTKTWAQHNGYDIIPNDTAVFVMKREAKELPDNYLKTEIPQAP